MHKPVNTRDTAVRVCGVSWCAKNLDRTRTRGTRFGSTAGVKTRLTLTDFLLHQVRSDFRSSGVVVQVGVSDLI